MPKEVNQFLPSSLLGSLSELEVGVAFSDNGLL